MGLAEDVIAAVERARSTDPGIAKDAMIYLDGLSIGERLGEGLGRWFDTDLLPIVKALEEGGYPDLAGRLKAGVATILRLAADRIDVTPGP